MNAIKVQKGQRIAKRKDKVKGWYLIQEGSVIQKLGFAEISLGPNTIIGILEKDWFLCDYITQTECVIKPIPCQNAEDLKKILAADERYRLLFLRTAIEQRHRNFVLYSQLHKRTNQFHACADCI